MNVIHNRRLLILLMIEAAALVFGLLYCGRRTEDIVWNGSQLVSDVGVTLESIPQSSSSGMYLDNSLTVEEATESESSFPANYIASIPVDLKPGQYEITISYSANRSNSYSITTLFDNWRALVGRQNASFTAGIDAQKVILFTGLRSTRGYQVRIHYNGDGYLYVTRIRIHNTGRLVWEFITVMLLLFVIADVVIVYIICLDDRKRKTAVRKLIILSGTAFIISIPLFGPLIGETIGDRMFHLARIEGLKESILNGDLPSRVSLYWNNGYGYAAPVFYGELFLLIPAVFRVIGFSVQTSFKLYIIFVNIATCGISYKSFSRLLRDEKAGVLSSVLYTLSPYRAVCIYSRNAVGEYTGMMFYPLIIWGLIAIYSQSDNRKELPGGDVKNHLVSDLSVVMPFVLGVSGLVECHILSTVMAGVFIILFCIVHLRKTFRWATLRKLLMSFAGIFFLNAWFLVPFLWMIMQGGLQFGDVGNVGRMPAHGVNLYQIFHIFPFFYGDFHPAVTDPYTEQLPYTIGLGFIVVLVSSILILTGYGNSEEGQQRKGSRKKMIETLLFSILALWMTTLYFPWDIIHESSAIGYVFTRNIQYPWRFLGIADVLLTMLGGEVFLILKEARTSWKHAITFGLTALLGMVVSTGFYLSDYCSKTGWTTMYDDDSVDSMAVGAGEYIPSGTDENEFLDRNCIPGEGVQIQDAFRVGNRFYLNISNGTEQISAVDIPVLFYKGYTAACSERGEGEGPLLLTVMQGTGNRLRIIIPASFKGTINVTYPERMSWKLADIVSLLTFAGMIAAICNYMKRRRHPGRLPR